MPTMDLISQSQSDSSFFTDWLFFSHTLIALISGMSALLAPRLYYSFIEHAALTYYQPIPPRKLLDDILRVYGVLIAGQAFLVGATLRYLSDDSHLEHVQFKFVLTITYAFVFAAHAAVFASVKPCTRGRNKTEEKNGDKKNSKMPGWTHNVAVFTGMFGLYAVFYATAALGYGRRAWTLM